MAEQDKVKSILEKLRRNVTLDVSEVADLQTHIDQLESSGAVQSSHHSSHSSPNSHYTHHHGIAGNLVNILDRILPDVRTLSRLAAKDEVERKG